MKNLISILLIVCALTLCLISCDNNNNEQENDNGNNGGIATDNIGTNVENEDDGNKYEKIDDVISVGSPFTEGLAYVQYKSYPDVTYCIDKSGNVIFKLDDTFDLKILESYNYMKFENGLSLTFHNYICDSKGNVTHPEDVGVTNFYNVAFGGKYILADVVVSSFDSSSQKMGVMDFSFNWIVEPTEEIYDAFYERTIVSANNYSFYTYYEDFLYHDDLCLNLKTGEITDNVDVPVSSEDFISRQELADKYATMSRISAIVNGKAAIFFYNQDTEKSYVSVIDNKGNLLYTPTEIGINIGRYEFDGENIVIADAPWGSEIKLEAINSKGNCTAFNTKTLPYTSHTWTLQDGVILIDNKYYYDINFDPLF